MLLVQSLQPILVLLYLSGIATVAFVCGVLFMGCPFDGVLISTFAAIVFGIYALNRYTDREDYINDPDRRVFFNQNPQFLYLATGALAGSALFLMLTERFTLYHFLLIAIGVAYSVRIVPVISRRGEIQYTRIKDLSLAKSTIPSLLWGTAFFGVTWSVYPDMVANKMEVVLLMVSCSLANFMNTNFADIRDRVGDASAGVQTLPVKFGTVVTFLATMVVPGILWLAAIIALSLLGSISDGMTTVLLINLFFPVLYIGAYYSGKFSDKLHEPIADSYILLFALSLVGLHLAR